MHGWRHIYIQLEKSSFRMTLTTLHNVMLAVTLGSLAVRLMLPRGLQGEARIRIPCFSTGVMAAYCKVVPMAALLSGRVSCRGDGA
jgi:hypothetical protein